MVVVFLFILRAKQKNCANFGGAAFADHRGGGANAAKRANGFFVGIGNLTMSKNTIYK